VSFLVTDRELRGGGHNRVVGPDFQWRPGTRDTLTGQFILSDTRTPVRPELAAEWDGRSLRGHALDAWWSHSTKTIDWFTEMKDLDHDFRADDGFVPQVGYRSTYGETGYTFRPQGFLRRLRTFAIANRSTDKDGALLSRQLSIGAGMDGKWNSFMRFRYANDRVRTGDVVLPRQQFIYVVQANPSRAVSQLDLEGFVGQEIDFANNRRGHGADVALQGTVRPTNHLELRLRSSRRWLNVRAPDTGRSERLFTAQVQRLRATYNFTARSFLRLIGQWVETNRDSSLFTSAVARRDGDFSGSALFAYKLNWQTVLFVGYGDNRALTETEDLAREDRQLFLKLSYAFQR
jgi:hypothetical protein